MERIVQSLTVGKVSSPSIASYIYCTSLYHYTHACHKPMSLFISVVVTWAGCGDGLGGRGGGGGGGLGCVRKGSIFKQKHLVSENNRCNGPFLHTEVFLVSVVNCVL